MRFVVLSPQAVSKQESTASVFIGEDPIDLVQLQGGQVAGIVYARDEIRVLFVRSPIRHQSKYRFRLMSLLPMP